jgi:hypothetical protein
MTNIKIDDIQAEVLVGLIAERIASAPDHYEVLQGIYEQLLENTEATPIYDKLMADRLPKPISAQSVLDTIYKDEVFPWNGS